MVLGVITLLCTLGWYCSYALTVVLLQDTGTDGPPFFPGIISLGGLILTFPPALICTLIAVKLVGWRHSWLAWGSFAIYVIPIVVVLLFM